ncbi:unnamed protein product, partial [Vitis vinifera]
MEREKALTLKAVAEEKYKQSKLKSALKYARKALRLSPDLDGVSEMITAFKILRTFWTACSTCRLLHQFERKYIGQNLMCPSCKKSFLALEVENQNNEVLASKESGSRVGRLRNVRSVRKMMSSDVETTAGKSKNADLNTENVRKPRTVGSKRKMSKLERRGAWKSGDFEIMTVEDSDFYDFDKDRVERSFKKGQVWAIYDDDDGMPRHYGLIDEVVSVNPFQMKMSWLDLQDNGDEGLIFWEKLGFHVSCGRFKVAKKTLINSVNFFSHVVDCERAAREVYRIYPKKGSVWALYNQEALGTEERNSGSNKRCYDIVVFLTSYSEMYGLSMAYLEKVEGFKTVFKRQEIGCRAIRWLEKDDIRMFSHQIPARKLCEEESLDPSKDYWELDPASLPSDLLTIGWQR